jgi:pimeloyl-ACP methyl ester carboxylesterase
MPELEPQRLDVPGAVLEVLIGGAAGPPVCRVPHPTLPPSREGGVLAELGRVVTVSPRGLGGSSAGAGRPDLTFGRLVEDLEAIRRHLGLARWLLHGASGGGEVLLRYALRYPEAVAAMVLVSCPPGFHRILDDPRTPLSPAHPERRPLLERWTSPPAAGDLVWSPLAPEIWVLAAAGRPRVVEWEQPEAGPTARTRVVWEEIVGTPLDAAALRRVEAPALVLHGRHDTVVPLEYGRDLSAALPNAELVVFEHSEHNVTRAEPERYRDVVRRFLAAHAPPTGPAGVER